MSPCPCWGGWALVFAHARTGVERRWYPRPPRWDAGRCAGDREGQQMLPSSSEEHGKRSTHAKGCSVVSRLSGKPSNVSLLALPHPTNPGFLDSWGRLLPSVQLEPSSGKGMFLQTLRKEGKECQLAPPVVSLCLPERDKKCLELNC